VDPGFLKTGGRSGILGPNPIKVHGELEGKAFPLKMGVWSGTPAEGEVEQFCLSDRQCCRLFCTYCFKFRARAAAKIQLPRQMG